MKAGDGPILVIHRGALGDFVLLFPLLQTLQARSRNRLFLITRPSHGELAKTLGLCARTFSCDSGPGYRVLCGDPLAAQSLLRETGPLDCCVAYLEDLDGTFTHEAAPHLATRTLVLSPRPREPGLHAQDHLQAPLKKMGVPPSPPPAPDRTRQGSILIHPGSGSPRKNFDFLFYLKLQAFIPDSRFLVGPVELEQALEWPGEVVKSGDLPALLTILGACRGLVCNDSGVGHLAAWLGVPTLSLFKTTDPAVWAPRGPRTRALLNPLPEAAAHAALGLAATAP